MAGPHDTPLRLGAQDASDLSMISAAMQDAIAQIGDIDFSARQKTLTIAWNRYRWENDRRPQRVRTGLQLGGVLALQSHNVRQGAEDAVINLLSIAYEAGDEPAGEVVFHLSGGGALRARVECLDVVMVDVSAPWPASRQPDHAAAEAAHEDMESPS